MRILSGRWAGRELTSPGGRVRPTAETLRGPWLDRLESDLDGARVLDLYAGTGALGLEALSRGAASCDFVENGRGALHALKANIARFRVKDRTRLFRSDARAFLSRAEEGAYDICLADPPYSSSLAEAVVRTWLDRPVSRILAVEHDSECTLPRPPRSVRVDHLRRDRSVVTLYRRR